MVILFLSVVIYALWWSVLISGYWSTDLIAVCQMAHWLQGVICHEALMFGRG
jgi:hypothetical protein